MIIIPVPASPAFSFTISLDRSGGVGAPSTSKDYTITIYQKTIRGETSLYVDVEGVVHGVVARDATAIVLSRYLGFPGSLLFIDTAGERRDPEYTGLGTRYQLAFIGSEED